MDILIICLLIVVIICTVVTAMAVLKIQSDSKKLSELESKITLSSQNSVKTFSDAVTKNQQLIGELQTSRFAQMDNEIKSMRLSMERHLSNMSKGFSDISSLTSGVNDLRKVLSNVKTRGILGEIQLGAILDEILSPEQYSVNVATVPKSKCVVEFAIKIPQDDEFIYLPIDSKFPLDAYSKLQDAYEQNDTTLINETTKSLIRRIRTFAKDIHDKYIEPPYTTDFAIMFLPVEGLYIEAVNNGLVETLQREFKVTLAGPSTMAAILNALLMGFKTIAVEKRSALVWQTLSEVKTEFSRFSAVLEAAQKHILQANDDLDKLIGVRMRGMERKLRDVESITDEI